jgi:hypothetical protein
MPGNTAPGGRQPTRKPRDLMEKPRHTEDSNGFIAEDEIDEVLGRANPNPKREGCPARDVLIALSRRERPIGDPSYEHLVRCSPCYREVRTLQQRLR